MDKQNARRKFLTEEANDDSNSLTESNGSLQNNDDISLPDESSQVYYLRLWAVQACSESSKYVHDQSTKQAEVWQCRKISCYDL